MSSAAALVALVVVIGAATAQSRRFPDWLVAVVAAALLVVTGVESWDEARDALGDLGPTVGFLGALLLLAEGCRRSGLFDALGALMAQRSAGRPRRLLALVFAAATATTAVLSLDATVVLLTPVVFATAARLRADPRPHVYACAHLANTASLLLPVSNLTNLLAFGATGLSFLHFAGLMTLPLLVALAIEWLVLSRVFAADLEGDEAAPPAGAARLPVFPLVVLAATLGGFVVCSALDAEPVWAAAAGAVVLAMRTRIAPRDVVGAVQPPFLVFVLALAVVVRAAGDTGFGDLVDALVPDGESVLALVAVAALAAVVANLVNNLPATLIILPAAAASGPGAVLAMLIGVNAGPNLTYAGSLATLLWRRIMHAHDEPTDVREFVRLGVLTVPAILLAATAALWLALQVL